jgi:hypothetical protein
MNQSTITLAAVAALTVPYFILHMKRHGKCETRYLFAFVVNLVGLISGIYIFVGAFDVIKTSPQNGVWGGITGIVLTIWTLETIITEVRALLKPSSVSPKEREKFSVSGREEP